MGRLLDILGTTAQLGIPKYAKVSEVVDASGWRFRRCRNRAAQDIIQHIRGLKAPTSEAGRDVVLWRHSPDDFR
ncbi:unnamed protein product, partial [Arabidopsis halleri]